MNASPGRQVNRLIRWFDHAHLPPHLQEVIRPISDLANHFDATLHESPEKTVGLRKLLEAKDCLVRAAIEAKG